LPVGRGAVEPRQRLMEQGGPHVDGRVSVGQEQLDAGRRTGSGLRRPVDHAIGRGLLARPSAPDRAATSAEPLHVDAVAHHDREDIAAGRTVKSSARRCPAARRRCPAGRGWRRRGTGRRGTAGACRWRAAACGTSATGHWRRSSPRRGQAHRIRRRDAPKRRHSSVPGRAAGPRSAMARRSAAQGRLEQKSKQTSALGGGYAQRCRHRRLLGTRASRVNRQRVAARNESPRALGLSQGNHAGAKHARWASQKRLRERTRASRDGSVPAAVRPARR